MMKKRVIKHPDRAEADRFFNYPYAAIEESLANAVHHKAFDVREPIEVRIEKAKIVILSFPGPLQFCHHRSVENLQCVLSDAIGTGERGMKDETLNQEISEESIHPCRNLNHNMLWRDDDESRPCGIENGQ